MKICPRCCIEKPDSEFGKNKSKKDGLTSYCRECISSYYLEWNKENADSRKETHKKYRENNKEKTYLATKNWRSRNKEKVNLVKRVWASLNKEKIKKWHKDWYENNKDSILAAQREKAWHKTEKGKESTKRWREQNKERIMVNNRNRKSALKNASGKVTISEWEEIKNRYGNRCLRCGKNDVKLTMDHVIPIAMGGSNTADNIQPLCGSCNSKKNTKIEDYR